jgi:NAD(P)-dependent dehydrogenase (short-subunit alcohol dehydrogenase family)
LSCRLRSGIGLETVRQLAAKQNVRVVAGARDPAASEGLQELVKASDGRVATVVLDVTSEESIAVSLPALRVQSVLRS